MKKFCSKCGGLISKNCKSGVCKKCYDWTGSNNPFYGKKHSKETREILSEKCTADSLARWKDDVYREKVISGISKPRRAGFKKEQRDRVTKWYQDNPKQRTLRATRMKKSWVDGKIVPCIHSVSESKKEIEMREDIARALPYSKVEKKTVRIDGKWYLPDVLIDDWIVVEFFGNYWHANPEMYNAEDEVHHGLKAKEIWERDDIRLAELRRRLRVFVVWEKEYKDGRFNLDDLVCEVMLAFDDG